MRIKSLRCHGGRASRAHDVPVRIFHRGRARRAYIRGSRAICVLRRMEVSI
jgi:hypothetical protein